MGAPGGPGAKGDPGTPADQSQVAALSARVASLEGQVGALQATLAGVTRAGSTLVFSGMNLQVLSGSGATDGAVNGLGNVIIGSTRVRARRPGRTTSGSATRTSSPTAG